jgi:hypothetical protein
MRKARLNNKEIAAEFNALVRSLRRLVRHMDLIKSPGTLSKMINEQLIKEGTIQKAILERFKTEGNSSGTPWAPLKTETTRQRKNLGFPPEHPILVRTGVLMDAAVNAGLVATEKGITLVLRDGPAPIYLGVGKRGKREFAKWKLARKGGKRLSDYAAALNFGNAAGTIPARPYFGTASANSQEAQLVSGRIKVLTNKAIDALLNLKSIQSALSG